LIKLLPMKKDQVFLTISIIIPILFTLSIWGYFAYFTSKINPQYDFVYVAPYSNPYLGYSGNQQTIYNPFEVQDNGSLKIKDCPTYAPQTNDINGNAQQTLDSSGNLVSFSEPYYKSPDNTCNNIVPKNLVYYRYSTKDKKYTQIDFTTLEKTRFTKGFDSPDGYSFKGDISTQNINYNYTTPTNIFFAASNKYNAATLTNKEGANVTLDLNESPYNRLFIGWVATN
jgi:hypothetical protein